MPFVSNSPEWLSTAQGLWVYDLASFAAATAICYDYVLLFGQEVDLVWRKPWSFVSTLYVVVRYLGLAHTAMAFLFSNQTFISDNGCLQTFLGQNWMEFVFTLAMDGIMILRIYAMFHRSRSVLASLIVCFLLCNVATGVIEYYSIGPSGGIEGLIFILFGTKNCQLNYDEVLYSYTSVSGVLFEIILLLFVVRCFFVHIKELRARSHEWGAYECLKLLIKDNVFYFVLYVIAGALRTGLLTNFASVEGGWVFSCIENIITTFQEYLFSPRLVLSYRQYHAKVARRDERGGIELSQLSSGTRLNTIVFEPATTASRTVRSDVV